MVSLGRVSVPFPPIHAAPDLYSQGPQRAEGYQRGIAKPRALWLIQISVNISLACEIAG